MEGLRPTRLNVSILVTFRPEVSTCCGGFSEETAQVEVRSGRVAAPAALRRARTGRTSAYASLQGLTFNSSTFQLIVSTFFRQLWMVSVARTSQVELRSGRSDIRYTCLLVSST